jgi:hypothetical protein
VDQAESAASGPRAVALHEPTCRVLGLAARCSSEHEVAVGALRLLESTNDVRRLGVDRVLDARDELVVGVVEAVEECVLCPPPDCTDVRARAEVEAARWVDDFIADDATNDDDVVIQQVMFLLAQMVADAVVDALLATHLHETPRSGALVEQLRRRACETLRRSGRLLPLSRLLRC